MEISFLRDTFLQALQAVMGVVERRNTFPMLANVLLKVEDEKVLLTATDLELELKSQSLLEKIQVGGAITVPGRKLFDIIRALKEGSTINLAVDNQKVIIKSERARYSLTSLPAEGYPSVGEETTLVEFEIAQATLLNLLQKTHFAMAEQDVRYFLNGMCWEVADNKLTVVALDGHRLALSSAVTLSQNSSLKVIVPRKGISELIRLLENTEGTVKVKLSSQHLSVKNDYFSMTSKLVDGKFPAFQPLLKQKGEKVFVANREVMKQHLIRASILCNDKLPTVNLTLRPNLLSIKANNPEQEQAEDECEIEYQGENMSFCFNVHYLLDVLNAMVDAVNVRFLFNNSDSGLFIEADNEANLLNMIMPLRM